MKNQRQLLLLLLLTILPICYFSQSSSSIAQVSFGSSYGECYGYCTTQTDVNKNWITQVKSSQKNNKDFPTKTSTVNITDDQWLRVINSFHLDEFLNLEETIGCPDCNDGGSCWISVTTFAKTYKVYFECTNPPNVIKELVRGITNL